jgi:hypothetical protein
MSAVIRLGGFAAVLLLVFGAAALAGDAVGPDRSGDARTQAGGHAGGEQAGGHAGGEQAGGHAGGSAGGSSAAPVRGLGVSSEGLTLALETTELERGRPGELRFSIRGAGGRPIREFEVEHEKRMHLIVVRRDSSGFQHLHPELDASGTWSVPVTLGEAGSYRVFADFKHDGEARTLAADLTVDGDADYRRLSRPTLTANTGDGYVVRLDAGHVDAGQEAELRFTVTRDGRAVETERYLGARGHLVALREGDLAYLHVHPSGDSVAFTSEFPTAGRYRLYLQFKHDGRVHTAAFTRDVSR